MMSERFDNEFLQRLLERDRVTEEHFVKYFAERLVKKLRSEGTPFDLVEDIKQETLLQALTAVRAGRVGDPARLRDYVMDICKSVLDESRRKSTRVVVQDESGRLLHAFHGADISASNDSSAEFTITFDQELSAVQVKGMLHALAEYYRACGGVGLEMDFELEEVLTRELTHV
jgi:DNA-directed RNA polymerase specialized sigma24 family protein